MPACGMKWRIPPLEKPDLSCVHIGARDNISVLRDLSLLLSLKPTGAGTGTHWDSIGVLEKGFAAWGCPISIKFGYFAFYRRYI